MEKPRITKTSVKRSDKVDPKKEKLVNDILAGKSKPIEKKVRTRFRSRVYDQTPTED